MCKIAIIGTGIAGMGAARLLYKKYDLTIFEKASYPGGHTHTVYIDEDDRKIPIDTGFIVFNYETYPNLCRLFEELKVEVKKTQMSFSVQHKPSGLEYCGSGINELFAQRKNIFDPSYYKFLAEINRFNKECMEVITNPAYAHYSVKNYVEEKRFGNNFIFKYLVPMTSALWSTPPDVTLTFPIVTLVNFFSNHGFLGLNTQLQWYTVHNGSWQYRDKLIAPFKDKIACDEPVLKVRRSGNKAYVTTKNGEAEFDKVIFACHADQALHMLEDASMLEQKLLSPFKYQKNTATLHTDITVMPLKKIAWSAWNYRVDHMEGNLITHCVYHMNILQNVSDQKQYMVSINDPGIVDKEKILKKIDYEHPVFTVEAMHAQQELYKLNENEVTFFCGSYFKYGFHEDALTSAINMSRKLLLQQAAY